MTDGHAFRLITTTRLRYNATKTRVIVRESTERMEMSEVDIEVEVDEPEPLLHQAGKLVIGGLIALLAKHFAEKAYDCALAAYRAKQIA
jgi:hypothetical protein